MISWSQKCSSPIAIAGFGVTNRNRPRAGAKFEKQPDAGLFSPRGVPEVFIEIAGSYRAERLAALMEFSNGADVPWSSGNEASPTPRETDADHPPCGRLRIYDGLR